jgi:hypothetical protein
MLKRIPECEYSTEMDTLPRECRQKLRDEPYTENHWIYGLCPSSGIINIEKTQRFGNWMIPSSGKGMDTASTSYVVCSLHNYYSYGDQINAEELQDKW